MRLRFRLRTLLIATAVLSLVLGFGSQPLIARWHLAKLRASYQRFNADFRAIQTATKLTKLPYEEGESFRALAAPWMGGKDRPNAELVCISNPDDRIADDASWCYLEDGQRRKYWAYYYPGYTTSERYRKLTAVFGPFDIP